MTMSHFIKVDPELDHSRFGLVQKNLYILSTIDTKVSYNTKGQFTLNAVCCKFCHEQYVLFNLFSFLLIRLFTLKLCLVNEHDVEDPILSTCRKNKDIPMMTSPPMLTATAAATLSSLHLDEKIEEIDLISVVLCVILTWLDQLLGKLYAKYRGIRQYQVAKGPGRFFWAVFQVKHRQILRLAS